MYQFLHRKELIGIITIILGIISYIPYIRNMITGKTKPHIFSRILRGTGALIVFAGQWSDGAWAGSWSNLLAGVLCLGIAIYAYFYHGVAYITRSDKIFFVLSVAALVLYFLTDTRLRSIILINIADIFSLIPTIRKSRDHPYTETMSLYYLSAIKFALMIAATGIYSFVTVSNSILRALLNAFFVIVLIVRRRQITSHR